MKIRIVFCFLMLPFAAKTQYFQYTQYNFTDQRINPAMVASSDYASAGIIFRNQSTGASDIRLKSSMVSLAYPFLSRQRGKRWSGIGLSLMDDRSGGIFTVQEASLSYGINVFLNRFQSLSLGFKGLFQQRRVNLHGLFTGSQYIDGRGFDASLFNGENFGLLRSDFLTFSSGLYWQQNDRQGSTVAYWGISIFDFNKADDSFSGIGNTLRSTWVASGGLTVVHRKNVSLRPEFLMTYSPSGILVNVGAVTSYVLKPYPNQIAGRVDMITKYIPGRSGIFGLQFHRDQFSIGFSYDFPIIQKNPGNVGAFELALQMRRLVEPTRRKRVVRKDNSARSLQAVKKDEDERKKAVDQKMTVNKDSAEKNLVVRNDSVRMDKTAKDLGSVLREKRDSVLAHAKAGRISHAPFLIEKLTLHFNFAFNSTALDAASMKYLNDLSEALKADKQMKVLLTGHTDNVGSATFNMRLSLFRANMVREYLLSRGVPPSRIETNGKGLTEPLNENKTEADRAVNRRVELQILYQE